MTRKSFVIVVLAVVVASFAACADKNPLGPTPTPTPTTTTTSVPPCSDRDATNYRGTAPCVYPDVVRISGEFGASGMKPEEFGGIIFPAKPYAGTVEAEVEISGMPPEYPITFMLVDQITNKVIRGKVFKITSHGIVSLPHDGSACYVWVGNHGKEIIPWIHMIVHYRKN